MKNDKTRKSQASNPSLKKQGKKNSLVKNEADNPKSSSSKRSKSQRSKKPKDDETGQITESVISSPLKETSEKADSQKLESKKGFDIKLNESIQEQEEKVQALIAAESHSNEQDADEEMNMQNQIDHVTIPSIQGSVDQNQSLDHNDDQKAVTEKATKQNELIDGDDTNADNLTNHKRLDDNNIRSKTLDFQNQGAQSIRIQSIDDEVDKEEIEMFDFGIEYKPVQKDKISDEIEFYEDHHSGGSTAFLDYQEVQVQSVHSLTLKEGINYDDARFDEEQIIQHYPTGFDSKDDLNGDGQIDDIERQVKIVEKIDNITDKIKDKIEEDYLKKFREEVDFHHKVAYRFEKAYRVGKKESLKKQALNNEITAIIEEHAQYLEQDPMALFYCLYFCIYYNNPELVEFLKILIDMMDQKNKPDKIDEIVKLIDENSIERLRQIGDSMNTHVYHMVFYQAIDDDLRIVYTQILRQIKFIMLRDKDAIHFLKQRDYELIRLTFQKHTIKLNIRLFYNKHYTTKSTKYRQYNQAYYEEILIDFKIDQRVAKNYRDRFLTNKEEIMLVLEMYCKVDYQYHFLKTDLSEITYDQFIELFSICIRNDSFKIALQIYIRYLKSSDITQKLMEQIIFSIRDTCMYHEMKLFFIHEYFNVLSIFQMNQLVDIYMDILHTKDYRKNPILSTYNTIKYALLIYRISWKISEKKIYQLITKCSLMNEYILKSLDRYLIKQQHISQLYKFMSEPILHMTERKDSLDIMLEMNMEGLLKHPVIVEVLNLVYEGKYSVDSSALDLSQTFQCFFLMETNDLKSINSRLVANVISFGDNNSGKQASLQFNIWKQCIEQREKDEMIFSVLFSCLILSITLIMDEIISEIYVDMEISFGSNFISQQHLFINGQVAQLRDFCQHTDKYVFLADICQVFFLVVSFGGIGYFTSIIQKFTVERLKDNVEISLSHLVLEISIVTVTIIFLVMNIYPSENYLITDVCKQVKEFTPEEITKIGFVNSMITQTNKLSFPVIVSVIVCQYNLVMIVMLQRTQKLGELIMMVSQMVSELKRFFITFGLLIGLFIIVGRQLAHEFKFRDFTIFQIMLDIFDGLNGSQDFSEYQFPQGKIFISIYVYIFNVLLLSFLVAMFINKYKLVWLNLEALKRMNIIKLKNSNSYDQLYGGITITFFPISIIMLPFIIPVVIFKSERLNDFILKIQYAAMIVMYCVIGAIIAIFLAPLLYFKLIMNALFIQFNTKREDYQGQNLLKLVITIFVGPLILAVSLVIDLLNLPGLLLIDERNFEFKYQSSLDLLTQKQTDVVLSTFAKIFYINFIEKFGGKGMNLMELMTMHQNIFSLTENLHDLCCRGTKDYKMALANVQDYNMTKVLTRQSSVPDKSGDVKLNQCDFNILYFCQMDIEIYNYVDTLFHDHRSGRLEDCHTKIQKMTKEELEEAEKGNGLNAGVVFLPVTSQPNYIMYKRDNADFMNNFFVNIIARAFTDIDEFLRLQEIAKANNKHDKILKELANLKDDWKNLLAGEVNTQFSQFDTKIVSSKMIGDFNVKDNQNYISLKTGTIGDQASQGIKILDKKGQDANIENLVDM